jgi:hypothetical protein
MRIYETRGKTNGKNTIFRVLAGLGKTPNLALEIKNNNQINLNNRKTTCIFTLLLTPAIFKIL